MLQTTLLHLNVCTCQCSANDRAHHAVVAFDLVVFDFVAHASSAVQANVHGSYSGYGGQASQSGELLLYSSHALHTCHYAAASSF